MPATIGRYSLPLGRQNTTLAQSQSSGNARAHCGVSGPQSPQHAYTARRIVFLDVIPKAGLAFDAAGLWARIAAPAAGEGGGSPLRPRYAPAPPKAGECVGHVLHAWLPTPRENAASCDDVWPKEAARILDTVEAPVEIFGWARWAVSERGFT